jgi:hypothetical protein
MRYDDCTAILSASRRRIDIQGSGHQIRRGKKEILMNGAILAQNHIGIIETLIQLYGSLEQNLDHCLNEIGTGTVEEHESQARLSATRAQIMDILAGNPVVKEKIEEECKRLLSLASACFSNGPQSTVALKEARTEREALRCKAAALRDLLEVLRSADSAQRQ